jgi:hypothetical protein
LYGADVLRSLPLVGNERYAGKIDITLFWPVLLLLCGILFLNRSRKLGLLCAVAGIIFLFGNFPFKRLAYDQYHGDAGDLPYQSVIDYVNQTAPDTGMVFWAHPEAPNFDKKDKIGPVYLQTPEYPESLLRTDGYTGFGYFQEGERTVGRPGGVWDQILTDYVNHKRRSPVWAVAELDFRKEGYLGTFLDSFENIMLLAGDDPVNETTLIRTMKTGKFYALKNMHGSYGLVLDDLGISDGTNRVTMGETLVSRCSLCLSFSLSASDGKEHMVNSTIISNGTILERVQAVTPSVIQLPLPTPIAGAYYRIEIESDNHSKIVTNPVFIR